MSMADDRNENFLSNIGRIWRPLDFFLPSSVSFWVLKGSGSHLRAVLELFGVVSERSWRRLGASWRCLGASWRRLGASWKRLGASWERLGASWERLEASWERLGASWDRLGAWGGHLGASWRGLKADFATPTTLF